MKKTKRTTEKKQEEQRSKSDVTREAKHSCSSRNWQTPDYIIEAARKVLGKIDLDPASTPKANKRVKAKKIFTKKDDGLGKKWIGRVFLNPPGGGVEGYATRSSSVLWLMKLRSQIEKGNTTAAIFVGFSLEVIQAAQKQQSLRKVAFCVPRRRIPFINPHTGEPAKSPGHANAILYFGPNPDGFAHEFEKIGDCHNVQVR